MQMTISHCGSPAHIKYITNLFKLPAYFWACRLVSPHQCWILATHNSEVRGRVLSLPFQSILRMRDKASDRKQASHGEKRVEPPPQPPPNVCCFAKPYGFTINWLQLDGAVHHQTTPFLCIKEQLFKGSVTQKMQTSILEQYNMIVVL